MQEILNFERSDDAKIKLNNAALRKPKLFQKKAQLKEVLKEKTIPESEILRKFSKKA